MSALASNVAAMTWRNLVRDARVPALMIGSTVQPAMFVLLFTYVFGGAIAGASEDYLPYLLPGLIVQFMVLGSTRTGVALAEDLSTGAIDRFRVSPMARSAFLTGRALADALRAALMIVVMVVTGLLVGFRFSTTSWMVPAGVAVAVAMGAAFGWASAWAALRARSAEGAQTLSFIWILPLTFANSVYVRLETMPGWLQPVARMNPVSHAADALRGLWLGGPVLRPVAWSMVWAVGITFVFGWLSTRRFRAIG